MHRWLLLTLPLLGACAPPRKEVAWPAADPRDQCFAGYAPAGVPAAPGLSVQPAGLTDESVRRSIRGHLQGMKTCYEAALTRQPGLSGRVLLRFSVGDDGTVRRSEIASSTFQNADLDACMGRAVCRWRFNAPAGGEEVTITYPVTFTAASPAP
jgi:TonB family protein